MDNNKIYSSHFLEMNVNNMNNLNHKYLWLEIHARLNDVRTENRRDDGCDNLKDFLYSIPFNHNVIVLKVRHVFCRVAPCQ